MRGNHEIRNAYSIGLRDHFDYVGDKTYASFNWGDTRISNRKSKFTEGRLCCISKYLFICLIKQHLLRTHTIIIFLSGLQAIYTYFMQFVIEDHLTVNNHTRTFQPGSICAIFHPAIRRYLEIQHNRPSVNLLFLLLIQSLLPLLFLMICINIPILSVLYENKYRMLNMILLFSMVTVWMIL